MRGATLDVVERQLFTTLSPRAKEFIPSSLRQAASPVSEPKEDALDEDDAAETSLAEESAASIAEEEAKQAAIAAASLEKENAAATLVQKLARRRLFQIKDREQHEKRAFIVLWRSYQVGAKPRPAIAGPLVELLFALEGYLRILKKTKDVLKKSWLGGKGDETKTADDISAVKFVLSPVSLLKRH